MTICVEIANTYVSLSHWAEIKVDPNSSERIIGIDDGKIFERFTYLRDNEILFI